MLFQPFKIDDTLQHSIKISFLLPLLRKHEDIHLINSSGWQRTLMKAILAQKTLSLFREIADDNENRGRGHSMLQHRSLGTFYNSNCILIEKY
jgi:hypothetical protein